MYLSGNRRAEMSLNKKAEREIGDDYPLNPKPVYFFAGLRSQALSRHSCAHMRAIWLNTSGLSKLEAPG
jgi:hypothetical protein